MATRTSVQLASAIQPLPLQFAPRHVVLLRPDQAEDVAFPAVLADQRRRQAEPPPGLNLRGDAEHGGRQEMNLVIDDETPIALVEELEVRELLLLVRPMREDLVSRHRDGADLLGIRRILGRLSSRQIGLVEDFAKPLLDGGDAGGEHQRVASASAPWR